MFNEFQLQQPEAIECTPRRLARRIEGCIVRNALDEERRAQKVLFLLHNRDSRIAFLEKRVIELENVAENIHQLSLRRSQKTLEQYKVSPDFARSEKSYKTEDESVSNMDSIRDSPEEKLYEDCDTSNDRTSIPLLNLSKSSTSNSEKDIFCTPAIDFLLEKKKQFAPNVKTSKGDTLLDQNRNDDEKRTDSKKPEKSKTVNNALDDENNVSLNGKEPCKSEQVITNKLFENSIDKKGASSASVGDARKVDSVSYPKHQRSKLTKTSLSVPWIRAKRNFRKKLRSIELHVTKRIEEPAGDGRRTIAAFRTIESCSLDRGPRKPEIVHGAKMTEKSATMDQEHKEVSSKPEEIHLIAVEKVDTETKASFTQTSPTVTKSNEKFSQLNEATTNLKQSPSSSVYLGQKKSSIFWSIDEDPAPQWLIEEALNRGSERSEQWTKRDAATNKAIKYEEIISELETELSHAKEDLEEALRSKSIEKEKYKSSLENVKIEARQESEALQEKIVRICTSVLEHFGPRAITKKGSYQIKCRRRLKRHDKISKKLHRKLRMAVAESNKLKVELTNMKETLKIKSEKYESISKCFDRLKQEMESAELNLNNLISENLSLRKKIEDTRECWLEHNGAKNHYIQRSRELTNLKKKTEEDFATISQLRNKLLRSESANANKGFLLNSYKSQLTDSNKEKNQLLSKVNSLENDVLAIRTSNSQLKAKISVLNNEKDKLLSDNEKSKTDLTQKMETQYAKKCEEVVQQEIDGVKAKYENSIKSIKAKMIATENQNAEYSKAIKEFLKKLCNYQGIEETQRSSNESDASEKEAHKTACNILNMTPEELSGFMNGKPSNSINSWIVEMNRIITKKNFAEYLSKFLFKKTLKKMKI